MRYLSSFTFILLFLSHPVAAAEPPRIVAHRGMLKHAPENTLASLRSCLALKVGFEVDLQRSQDGALICIHDETLDRTTNGSGRVAEHSLNQLRKLDAGSWFAPGFRDQVIPTFEEVLRLVRASADESTLIAVDLKANLIEADAVKLACEIGCLNRLLFIGTAIRDPAVRKKLRAADDSAQVACLANDPGQLKAAINDRHSDWVYFRYLPTRSEIARVNAGGKRSFIAGTTVSGLEPNNWRRSIYVNLDSVLTDYPLELAAVVREVQTNASQYTSGKAVSAAVEPLTYAESATVGVDSEKLESAASLVQDCVENNELRGAVLLVARRGKVILHEALGFRDDQKQIPMEKDSLFRMASNTKAVTAAGILTLVQQGLIDLDDPAGKYIATFNIPKSSGITVRHLLTHTSGLRIASLFLKPLLEHDPASGSQLLREVARFGAIGPEVPPGTSYAYNNPGYNTLAGIIEAVTGSYKQHLLTTVYRPLGMSDSFNHEPDADQSRMSAVFHRREDGTWVTRWQPGDDPEFPFPRGSGGMVSSALDYATFCHMLLNRGVFGQSRVIDEGLVHQATNPQNQYIPAARNYGLGWVVSRDGGAFSHSGSDGTWVHVDPNLELIAMLLTQSQTKRTPRNAFRDLVTQACLDPASTTRGAANGRISGQSTVR